ncbi:MAG: tryptophanyl-tRNA synthetase [Acidimicrobiaceae bacterium]|nr:tryptophanyl-tRNA synthetase [Acidimicrobiaceae bacterium]
MLSGLKPTGHATLGNLLGALRFWAEDQHDADALFPIVDLHALTVDVDPDALRSLTLELTMVLMAVGLDPDVCTLFVQSHVPQHPRLTWLLECTASFGELRRMTQFKDKSAKGGEGEARAGLLTYPVLMAADILLYDVDRVPVGDDQRQHLELTRDLAMRFNHRYGDTFVVPEASIPKVGARIMDLQDPTGKMGKSHDSPQGTVYVLDDPKDIERKIKRAVTDTGGDVRYDVQAKPGVSNLLTILGAVTGTPVEDLAASYTQYGPLKADTAEAVVAYLRPVQDRYAALAADPAYVHTVLDKGAAKAEGMAADTYARAAAAMGLLPR